MADALAVANLERLGRREVGVKGYMDDVRAVKDEGLIVTSAGSEVPLARRIESAADMLPEIPNLKAMLTPMTATDGLD